MRIIIVGDESTVKDIVQYAKFRGLNVEEGPIDKPAPSISERAQRDLHTLSYLGQSHLPRGLRNNNPGNIRINDANKWLGKRDRRSNTDGEFEQFVTFRHGVRAMIKLVKNYIQKGFDTPEKIVLRYAPPSENHTSKYIDFVTSKTGYPKDSKVGLHDQGHLLRLVQAMAWYETGKENCISREMFISAEAFE